MHMSVVEMASPAFASEVSSNFTLFALLAIGHLVSISIVDASLRETSPFKR